MFKYIIGFVDGALLFMNKNKINKEKEIYNTITILGTRFIICLVGLFILARLFDVDLCQ